MIHVKSKPLVIHSSHIVRKLIVLLLSPTNVRPSVSNNAMISTPSQHVANLSMANWLNSTLLLTTVQIVKSTSFPVKKKAQLMVSNAFYRPRNFQIYLWIIQPSNNVSHFWRPAKFVTMLICLFGVNGAHVMSSVDLVTVDASEISFQLTTAKHQLINHLRLKSATEMDTSMRLK